MGGAVSYERGTPCKACAGVAAAQTPPVEAQKFHGSHVLNLGARMLNNGLATHLRVALVRCNSRVVTDIVWGLRQGLAFRLAQGLDCTGMPRP